MNLKDLENLSNATDKESLQSLNEKGSSAELLSETTKEWERIIHPVNYSTASNFARFGSAEKYYVDAISNIYNTFPYDGSKKERQEWRNNASDLDLYFIDNLYPKTTGYINLGKGVTSSGLYRYSSTPQYVNFYGGPNQGTTFDKSNIFDSASNRTSNLSIDFSKGNTIEFWFKDNAVSSSVSTSVFQLRYSLFHIKNNNSGLQIERRNSINSFRFFITSGSTTFRDMNVTIPNPNNWHHYAFSFIRNSADPSKADIKFYLDGQLNGTSTTTSLNLSGLFNQIGMTGSIGADLNLLNNGVASGSFDEFRFWKRERSEQEIRENMYSHIGGGVNTDDENIDLGVYFKFNEGIVGNTSYDKTILDYSGRISNGTIINYDTSNRDTGSAMQIFNSDVVEPKDPIIYSVHPDVTSLYNTYQSAGSEYDQTNANCLVNTVPSWILEAEQEEGRDELVNLFQIISSYLDNLHIQTEYLSKMRYAEYVEGSYKPYPLYSKFLNSYDFNISDLFKDANFSEYILSKNKDLNFEKNLDEIKNYIYRNIYNNLSYIYKSKGTNKSFRNLLRCFGIDEKILKINIYSDNAEYTFEDKTEESNLVKTFIDFNSSIRNSMTVFQTASFSEVDERSYISGSFNNNFELIPNTIESEIVFPYRYDIMSEFFESSTIISSSLFGAHEANEDGSILTWANGDAFNFQVYAVRPEFNSKDVKFAISSSAFGGVYLESNVFKNVYNDEKWNIAVKFKNNKNGLNDITGYDTTEGYLLEFYGVNTISGDVITSFNLSKSLGSTDTSNALKRNKRVYIGAHRQDFTGSVLAYSDVRISSLRYWFNYLSNDEINKHAQDPSSYGISDPISNAFFGINSLRNYGIPNIDTLVLNWDFNNITSSDSSGKFYVYDSTSGSLNNNKYGSFSNILFRKHSGLGTGSLINSDQVINVEYLSIGANKLPETVSGKEMIQILDEDSVRTNKDIKPTTYGISFEKSMYQTLSEDMLKLFSSVSDLNTIIGHPLNTIKNSYKDLEYLRRLYFNKINNTPDLEKYIEFYKWIDSSITMMLANLVPAGTKINKTLSNVVESHILERNKANFNKINSLRTVQEKYDSPVPMVVINNLNYSDIKPPNSPAGQLWLQKRADRTKEPLVSSGNPEVDGAREQLRKAIYYKNNVKNINSYDFTNNNIFEGNKDNYKMLSSIYSIKGQTPETQKINKNSLIKSLYSISNNFSLFLNINISSSYTDVALSKQKIYASINGSIAENLNSDLVLPFKIYKDINTGVIYFTNIHEDQYGNNQEIGLQGPFTETHVGGNLHRHALISQNADRNELYSFDGTSQLSASSMNNPLAIYREERAKRPVNIKNIKNRLDGTRLGNYSKNYEVISINGRNNVNLDFILSGGISTTTSSNLISLFKERNLKDRTKNETVIVNRFSTPGAETSGRGSGDLESETFSVYNSINNRNIKVRKYLDRWMAQTWSIDDVRPSFHKINKNTNYKQDTGSSGLFLSLEYDNQFVQYQIPQSDRQYMWISSSITGAIISSGFINSDRPNVDASSYITFISGVDNTDFNSLNIFVSKSANTSSNLISPVGVLSPEATNKYLLSLNGPYQHPSWKQLKGEQNSIIKLYRNNNIITVQDKEKRTIYQDSTKGIANTFSSFVEPPFEINYPVKQKIIDLSNNAIIDVVSEYDNANSNFANPDLVSKLTGSLPALKDTEYDNYKKLYTDASGNFSLKEAEYKDRIFPRNENLGLIKIRSKPNYMEVAGTGSNGYDRNVSKIRSFWRNKISDRTRSVNATSSAGYVEYSQVGYNNYIGVTSCSNLDPVNEFNNYYLAISPNYNYSYPGTTNYLTRLTYSYGTKNSSSIFSQDSSPYTLSINTSVISSMTQSAITASNRIAGELFSYSELETKFFVLKQSGTIDNNYYFLYNPTLPASASNVIIPKPQLFYMNAGAKFIYKDINSSSSNYITINTGSQYTMTSSGKSPWYDSYEEYFQDIKNLSYDKSYLAEYTFEDVSDFYLKQKNGDFKSILTSSYLFLDGESTGINYSGSYTISSLTTNTFNQFLLNDNSINSLSKKISIKINGIKKLLPYKGFYPAERTVQIYKEFLKSWTGLSLDGDFLNKKFRLHPSSSLSSYLSIKIQENFVNDLPSIDGQLLALTQPLFSPGILFNSLKAGIAVDWPVMLNSMTFYPFAAYNVEGYRYRYNYQTPYMYYDPNAYDDYIVDQTFNSEVSFFVSNIKESMIEPLINRRYDFRLPFTSLLDFETSIPNNFFNGEYGLLYLHPTYYSPSIFSGDDRNNLRLPYYYLKKDISGSVNESFSFKNNLYKLAMHNFLSEVPSFFLKDNLTTFQSKTQNTKVYAKTGSIYCMDIILSKKGANKRDFSKFGQRNHYGPPNAMTAYGVDPNNSSIKPVYNGMMSDFLSNYSMAPHSPPYYYEDSVFRITFIPDDTRDFSLKEIIEKSKKEQIPANFNLLYIKNVYTKELDYPGIEDRYAMTPLYTRNGSEYYMSKSPAVLDAMPLTSSVSIDILTSEKLAQFDEYGYPISITDHPGGELNKWVIQTKWESPFISTSDSWDYWAKYGIYQQEQDLTLRLADSAEISTGTSSLADLVGFEKISKKVGEVANSKEIREAIVMIPYTYTKNHDDKTITARTLLPLLGENGILQDRRGADFNNPSYFYVDKNKINELVGLDISSEKLTLDQIKNRLTSPKLDQNNNIVKTMRSMMDYNLPPHLDWITNKNVDPFVMYIFEFKHNLDQEDLVDIWQGLMPKIARNAELDSVTVEHDLTEYEFFHGKQLPDDIRWKVFKIKKRANTNYYKLTADSKDDARFKFQFAGGLKEPEYSYNWPYDYFSLVEMANIDASIKVSDNKPPDPTLVPFEKWLKPEWADIPKELLGDNQYELNIGFAKDVGPQATEVDPIKAAKDLQLLSMPTGAPGAASNVPAGAAASALGGALAGSLASGTGGMDKFAQTVTKSREEKSKQNVIKGTEKYAEQQEKEALILKKQRYNKVWNFLQKIWNNGTGQLAQYKDQMTPPGLSYEDPKLENVIERILPSNSNRFKVEYNIDVSDFDWYSIGQGIKGNSTSISNIKTLTDAYSGFKSKYRLRFPPELTQDELEKIRKYENENISDAQKTKQESVASKIKYTKSLYE